MSNTNSNTGSNNGSNKILEIKTIQSFAFRVMIESLKELLTEVSIEFKKKEVGEDGKIKGGMKITSMDPKKSVLVYLKLDAANFETFICNKPKITIGVHMGHFFKFIKTANNTDTLTLFIEEQKEDRLGIKIDNPEKGIMTKYHIKLMDLPSNNYDIPPTQFAVTLSMPSIDFYKYCKDMLSITTRIKLQCIENKLILKGDGAIGDQTTTLTETENGLNVVRAKENNSIIEGKYDLEHLVLFTKCTSLCTNIELFMKNEYPLIVHYTVATLGNIYLCLTPVGEEDENANTNAGENDE